MQSYLQYHLHDSCTSVYFVACVFQIFIHIDVTIGLEDPEIVVDEDAGTVEICARILDGVLDREITVTLTTSDGTAVCKSSIHKNTSYVSLFISLICGLVFNISSN